MQSVSSIESDDSYVEEDTEHPRALLGVTKKSKIFDNIKINFFITSKQILKTSDVYLHQAGEYESPFKGRCESVAPRLRYMRPNDNCPSDNMLNIFLFLDDITRA